jgi:acyl-CoA synthetase (AMP-forming)/AMP-acid ligase II
VNLADFCRYWGTWRGEHPAIVFGDIVQSWHEVDARSDAIARGLMEQGIRKGYRVGLLMTNRPEVVHIVLAVLKVGAICVPFNFRLTPTELRPLLEDADCTVVITEENLSGLLEPAAANLSFTIFATEARNHRPYESLNIEHGPAPVVDVIENDPAFICYTSGTTGVQKGALLTHGNVIYPGQARVLLEGVTWQDRALVAVPLVYTGAIIGTFVQISLYAGCTTILEANFDPDRYLSLIERHHITCLSAVPVVWERLARTSDFYKRDISSLVHATTGGAPVSLNLLETFNKRGIPLSQVYGQTEAVLTAMMFPHEASQRIGFAGRPLIGTQIRITSSDGRECATGEVGEILIRGPQVMREYWNKSEATAEAVVNGWLRSGDLGLLNEEGYLKVVDRTKDMLISGGLNVYPAEIERTLGAIDGILDLAVIGVPDENWGEVPLVVFHTRRDVEGVLAEIELIGQQQLAGFKRPKFALASTEPLPRTFSGKLFKPAIRKMYPRPPADAVLLFGAKGGRVRQGN